MKCSLFRFILVALCCACCFYSRAQFEKAIKIGEKIPDIVFENVLNYKTKKAKISDFKGKLLILDMWTTYCTSCIEAFPEMEELQKKFGNKIQILLVNSFRPDLETEEKIKLTLNRRKARTGFYPTLPIPIHDTILETYFPHMSVPHEVWINEEGVVIAITNNDKVNERNINMFLAAGKINLPVKNDWGFDTQRPFLLDGNGSTDPSFLYRSLLTGYKADLNSPYGTRGDENAKATGIFYINETLIRLITIANPGMFNEIPDSRIILEVGNPGKYQRKGDTSNMYCYDLSFPPSDYNSFDPYSYLREDLKRIFNVTARRQKMKRRVLVMKGPGKISSIYSKYHEEDTHIEKKDLDRYFHGVTVDFVARWFSNWADKPLMDESGIVKKIDINFPKNINLDDQNAVLSFLRTIGFNIQEEEREIDVVIISDKTVNYNISFQAKNLRINAKAYLRCRSGNDTVSFENGRVNFTGEVKESELAFVYVDYEGTGSFNHYYTFYLSPGKIDMSVRDPGGNDNCEISGNAFATDLEYKLIRPVMEYNKQNHEYEAQYEEAAKKRLADTTVLKEKRLKAIYECFQVPQKYVKENPNSPVSIEALKMMGEGEQIAEVNVETLKQLYDSLTPSVKNTKAGKDYEKFLSNL